MWFNACFTCNKASFKNKRKKNDRKVHKDVDAWFLTQFFEEVAIARASILFSRAVLAMMFGEPSATPQIRREERALKNEAILVTCYSVMG